jgi:hypothetical protein
MDVPIRPQALKSASLAPAMPPTAALCARAAPAAASAAAQPQPRPRCCRSRCGRLRVRAAAGSEEDPSSSSTSSADQRRRPLRLGLPLPPLRWTLGISAWETAYLAWLGARRSRAGCPIARAVTREKRTPRSPPLSWLARRRAKC